MGVRVKIKVNMLNKEIETIALANSGFETDTPQLLVPKNFLVLNEINLDNLGKPVIMEYDTAGGSIAMYVYPRSCRVRVVEPDTVSREVIVDLVISPIEREVVMSDALIEELGIILLSPRKGLWRFVNDPVDKIRESYKPTYW
ncbi:MAG: hypothetical protein B6U89_02465 [Desulfurococcales archaeon ex4484_58]|nr:MAG: hypothetical protein B6U89_02465 [Desulfurococcales archaeon ex4484_58]